jgi:septal ring factor EnvC (AmiA/AmiB activator)
MERLAALLLVLLLVLTGTGTAQKAKAEAKQKELSQVRHEIQNLESQLKNMGTKEKKTFAAIEKYNKQMFLINRLIASLHEDEQEKQEEIETIQGQSASLQSELGVLKQNYSRYVTAVYQKLYQNKLLYFLSANSISQGLLRQYYLRTFSERGKNDADRILRTQIELHKLEEQLTREKNIKQAIIVQKADEESYLSRKANEQQSLLKKLKGDKTQLKKELDEKRVAEQRIKDLVNKLIARDREREHQRELAEAKTKATPTPKNAAPGKEKPVVKREAPGPVSGPIASLRGKMGWPVNGSVVKHYGETKNSATNTVTLNYGVDIKTSANASVKSIYSGEISAIEWLPGYRTIVIISHGNNFRSVYGNLQSANVHEGQKVSAGEVIGSAGAGLEGSLLHFEIWNDRQSQNPEIWLSRK